MDEPDFVQQIDRTYALLRGRKVSYFAGCDYFRLASHPRILAALRKGISKSGFNVAASRMTTGNHRVYQETEKELTKFFRADAALLVPSGYMTNLVVAQTLAGHPSQVYIDERAHPSLQDAARLFLAPVIAFPHRNASALQRLVSTSRKSARAFLLTDGMFAHDGSVAPLAEYLRILPRTARLLVDDAHGAGVVGATGRGSLEAGNLSRERIIQTVTLSKAFGVYGGAILCSPELRRKCMRSPNFVGSTPLPLPLCLAAATSLRALRDDRSFLKRLREKTARVSAALNLRDEFNPILPVHPRSRSAALRLVKTCRRRKIFPSLVLYPGGPPGGYFRFVISSEHSSRQIDDLISVLREHVADGSCRVLVPTVKEP